LTFIRTAPTVKTGAETTLAIGRKSRAFTLVELILVMVVVSVVLALSAPRLRGFFVSRQTADAAAMVLSLTKWARSEAISQGRPVHLNVDPSGAECWLTVQEAGLFVSPKSEIGRRFPAPEGATIAIVPDTPGTAPTYVEFLPSGRSDTATIEIRSASGQTYQVVTDSATEPYHIITPTGANG
jgi:prepilin-type N-terminal cleavage/methylation domain-containing protein